MREKAIDGSTMWENLPTSPNILLNEGMPNIRKWKQYDKFRKGIKGMKVTIQTLSTVFFFTKTHCDQKQQ